MNVINVLEEYKEDPRKAIRNLLRMEGMITVIRDKFEINTDLERDMIALNSELLEFINYLLADDES